MHLFTRTRQIDLLQEPEGFALATEMAHVASTVMDLEVTPWASVYGLPLGTVVYSARVESQAAVAAGLAKVSADAAYQRLIEEGGRRLYVGPGEDAIGEIVSVAGTGESTANLASVVVAQCAPGRIAEAAAWGVDILSHASKLTGLDGFFVRNLYGAWATLVWISVAETMEEIDGAGAAEAADATFLERIDDGGPLFRPGSASQRLLRSIG